MIRYRFCFLREIDRTITRFYFLLGNFTDLKMNIQIARTIHAILLELKYLRHGAMVLREDRTQ